MIVLPCSLPVYFDVDDTLVMWNPTPEQLEKDGVDFTCPAGQYFDGDDMTQASPEWTAKLVPHKKHIEMLKLHKMRNHAVIVWSAGGWDWAEAVVKALGLESYVDLVITKPRWAYDDMPADRILPDIQWLEDK